MGLSGLFILGLEEGDEQQDWAFWVAQEDDFLCQLCVHQFTYTS